jgi:hypothetical protein
MIDRPMKYYKGGSVYCMAPQSEKGRHVYITFRNKTDKQEADDLYGYIMDVLNTKYAKAMVSGIVTYYYDGKIYCWKNITRIGWNIHVTFKHEIDKKEVNSLFDYIADILDKQYCAREESCYIH